MYQLLPDPVEQINDRAASFVTSWDAFKNNDGRHSEWREEILFFSEES